LGHSVFVCYLVFSGFAFSASPLQPIKMREGRGLHLSWQSNYYKVLSVCSKLTSMLYSYSHLLCSLPIAGYCHNSSTAALDLISTITYLYCLSLISRQYCWLCRWNVFKSMNIWQSYRQRGGCLVHFLRLLAVCWPGAQSVRDYNGVACNFAKYSPILIFVSLTDSSNKPLLTWLLKSLPHLKYVAIIIIMLFIVSRLFSGIILFHKVVWQHTQGMAKPIITSLLQIY